MPRIKTIALISSLSILLSIGIVNAEETPTITLATPTATKIGYVHAQRILEETKAGKKIKRELDNLATEKRAKLEAMKDKIMKLDDELAKKQLVLSIETKGKMEEDIRQKQLDLKRYQEDSLAVLRRFEGEALKKVNDTAMKIIKKIGEEENYILILEVRESNILYANPSMDITDQVILAYDQEEVLGAK